MKWKTYSWLYLLMCVLFTSSVAGAAPIAPTAAEITGEIEKLTLNDPTNIYSGGVMIVGGTQVILPKNLLIDLPANRLTLQQIFTQAPAACVTLGESGLAKADKCNASGTGGFATLSAVHTNAGNVIAGDVKIEKGTDDVSGVVSYINFVDGYFRVNGIPNDPSTGAMVRLNDPTSRHTVQQGAGCTAGAPNCSADPRFTLDPDNYVSTFTTGYPLCIPSTRQRNFPGLPGIAAAAAVAANPAIPGSGNPAYPALPAIPAGPTQAAADGTGDLLCPSTNRTPGLITEPPVNDSRRFAPIMVGDSIVATGNYETVGGVRFLSAHTTRVNRALETKKQAGQPDYMFLQEVFMEAPGFQNQRARMLIIGYATKAPVDVDFWTIHRDPSTNAIHEFPLASTGGCDIANGLPVGGGQCSSQGLIGAGANIFRIRYDVDFLLAAANDPKYPGGATAKLNPCLHLQSSPRFSATNPGICSSGVTLGNNFGIMSPIPHEIQARTGHKLDQPTVAPTVPLLTFDINGAPATNGQYLFPFGINLGGVETADFLEIDVNLLDTPRIFEGIPWNLDRRLSPSGCLDNTGAPLALCPSGAMGTYALDPFPYTGLDPRIQANFAVAGITGGTPTVSYNDAPFTASALTHANDRVFSFVDAALGKFNGNATLLPYVVGSFPADPPLITILPTPVLNIFPPIADEDTATTTVGFPVTINVLANDLAVFGTVDNTSVRIATIPPGVPAPLFATLPSGATVQVNADGSITYSPAGGFSGTDTFTYTVANNFASVSNPGTVTVNVARRPEALNDAVSTPANTTISIDVIANDVAGTSLINLASVNILSGPTCGSLVNQIDGRVLFTAPATPGTCTFSYSISDVSVPALISSTIATVTVTVTAPLPPVANNDSATVNAGSTTVIDVTANDTSAASTINKATLSISAATGGSAVANPNGTVSYTAPTTAGSYSFSYTIKDNAASPVTSNVATVSISVTPVQPPGTPTQVSPLGSGINPNAQFVFTAVAGATGYLIWHVDPLAGGLASSVFSPAQANCPTNTGNCSISFRSPFPNGAHFWQVAAQNAGGTGSWSSNTNFTVGPPTTPGQIAPNGAGISATAHFVFTAVAGATGYQIWHVDPISGGSASSVLTPTLAGCPTNTGNCDVTLSGSFVPGNHFWQVMALNTLGNSDWSPSMSFTVVGPPDTPVQVSPISTGTGINAPFVFTAVAGATSYTLWHVDPVTGGSSSSPLTPTQVGCPTNTGNCSVNFGTPFTVGAHFWQVSAQNTEGNSLWSPSIEFIVQ